MLGLIDEETFERLRKVSEVKEWQMLVQTTKLLAEVDYDTAEYQRRIAFYKADPL